MDFVSGPQCGIPVLSVLLLAVLVGCGGSSDLRAEGDASFKVIGNIDRANFPEPSGITYHPGRKTLFVVGDRGHIMEMRTDGTVLRKSRVKKADFEGVTCDPKTGLLYLADEEKDRILEVDPVSFAVRRRFKLELTFRGKTEPGENPRGLEAIAYVADAKHPEGGTFFVADQGKARVSDAGKPPGLLEVSVPLRSSGKKKAAATILNRYAPGVRDLSGLCFDDRRRSFLVVSDRENLLLEISHRGKHRGKILRRWPLPGKNQEGVAQDTAGHLYIAQDSGGIIKLKWLETR